MHNVIEMIDTVYELPVSSSLAAIQEYNSRARDGKYEYGPVLRSLLGDDCQELENPDHARVQVGYVIQLAIETHLLGGVIDVDSLYVEATAKARAFAREMSWAFAKKEVEEKLDEHGRPKPKKGSKGERSYEIYCEMVAAGNATRKTVMEAFQDEEVMGMQPHTKKGASSYFYIVKNKYEKLNG
jgi:hypothetical protein